MKLFSRSRGTLSAQERNFHPQNNTQMQGRGVWAHGNCRWNRDFLAHLPLRSHHSKGPLIGLLILPKVPGKAAAAPTQNWPWFRDAGLPRWLSEQRIHLPTQETQEIWFDPWVGKILWRRAWKPTPVFLSGESLGTEEPGGLQSMRSQSWTQLSN